MKVVNTYIVKLPGSSNPAILFELEGGKWWLQLKAWVDGGPLAFELREISEKDAKSYLKK